ncbi:hypothetical protein OSB04_021598 [Centaurea solstitialis]|uniref:C2 domain-containing protein n=1 Tax=Centaurea solstitialis TaxID=347529 RepID=A0AA38T6J0_9ASTR|nr:hypothetical protein OSB04_021598 [Centaurea solstitialis]
MTAPSSSCHRHRSAISIGPVNKAELVPNEAKVLTLELSKNKDPNDVQNEKARRQITVELLYKPFKEEDMPTFEDAGDVQKKAPIGSPAGVVYLSLEFMKLKTSKENITLIHTFESFLEERKKDKGIIWQHLLKSMLKTPIWARGPTYSHIVSEPQYTALGTRHFGAKCTYPRWNEELTFTLEEPPMNDKLHVEVASASSRIGLLHPKESLGYIDINLADVVHNKRINKKYHLINSRNGKIQNELQWRTPS